MKWTMLEDNTDEAAPGDIKLQGDTAERLMGLSGFPTPCVEILNDGRYRAIVQDVECMWRWEIHRDGQVIQEGCSLSEGSSREAVDHVMAFYRRRDRGRPDDGMSRQ